MGSQPSIYHCQKANFIYPCPTSTPTPTPTPSITPSVTPTHTPTPTPTHTPTPTTPVKYVLFQVQSCCAKKIIKYIMLPSNFLPGTAVVNSFGECLEIISVSKIVTWVTDFWDHGTTYIFCEVCVKYQTCNPVIPPSFISVWRTTTINESITLPYETSGFYYGTIDWGDGETSNNIYDNRTHTYVTPGDYIITITGTLIGWSFGVNPISRNKIREVLQWGCLRLGNSGSYFSNCNNLSLSNVTDVLDLTGTNNLSYTFENCTNLTTVPFINSWNTSNVTNMQGMFFECHNFNDDISGWDVSNVTDMGAMFDNTYLFNQPIGVWDVSNVQSISYMFLQNTVFNQNLSSWNVGSVTNMKGTFNGCTSFNNGGSPMISGWTTYNVTDMGDMFPLTPFNQPINSWDVSSVTKMDYMFYQSTSFNQPLSGWNVSNVTDMNYMFSLSPFNQYINSWDVSNVTTMEGMFFFNTIFNQNLNSWDVSSVTNMDYMFWFDYAFDGNITSWDTSNVTTMRLMFATCSIFNQNISGWNVGNVTNMQQMFNGATQFNQPIGSWNVSNVTNMSNMFGSVGFNQNIGSWNVTGVTNFNGFMNGKTFSDYSTTNLDAIYNGWSSLPTLTSGININFGTIKYTAGSSAGRAILTGTYGWTIIDGGI
jgi:surface protein